MKLGDAVDLRYHDPLPSETLRLDVRWDALAAEHVVMLRPKPHNFVLHSSRHYIALLNGCREDGETTADGLPRSTLRDGRGKLIFIPAGCRLHGWAQPGASPIAFTAAYLDPSAGSWPDTDADRLVPMLHFEHPLLAQMMLHLDRILTQPGMYSRVYAEAFAMVMLAEIMHSQAIGLSRGGSRTGRASQVKGGLAGWRCRAVCDYIEEHLAQDVSLTELAAIVELSPYHFCRAFKEAVGEPPHRYQMRRRVERAKGLLANRSLSIADVAAAVGYNSPSQFSALFARMTGLSPGTYRRKMI
ncbi:helix-turn-helix transcriptional regulator [Microvirga sp. BT688]|uniref:helix-turn-helix domain-containing protein n=1 Tax=Microvirga sp. TaxID=1873136 RepID=UPI001688770C|nr:AraC family transcriptional regulator [Microvirga sp.]MBD2750580.1 helix-turn-helix transcriptional regulator [Microvirga sp.]